MPLHYADGRVKEFRRDSPGFAGHIILHISIECDNYDINCTQDVIEWC